MSSNEVTLASSIRANLLSNQQTQKLIDITTNRLSTGRKVNSPLDNVGAFFASQSLTTRSKELDRLLDGMGQAIQNLKAVDSAIASITSVLEQMQAIARDALEQAGASGGAPADQAALESSYNSLRTQLDQLSADSVYRGINLLRGSVLTVVFNEDATSNLTITGVDFTVAGDLAISSADFSDATTAQGAIDEITAAIDLVRGQGRVISSNLTVIQIRQGFTQNMINILKEGSDKLTLADMNEEGANLVALQTRQQLGTTALSLAAQSQQSVLRLFN